MRGELVIEELSADLDPYEAALGMAHLDHLLLFDSSDRDRGRYSYLMAEPVQWIEGDFRQFSALETLPKLVAPDWLPPFRGGWAGLFGYGLQHAFEEVPRTQFDEFQTPDFALGLYDTVISWDHWAKRCWRVSWNLGERPGVSGLRLLPRQNRSPLTPGRSPKNQLPGWPNVTSNFSKAEYLAAAKRVVEYIHAGDAFQVNLSQRLLAPVTEHPLELYGRLRQVSPAPYSAYFDLGAFQIASASPERFLQVSPARQVVTRPIKGTRPRGKTAVEDAELLRDLTTNPKDRAENVMIVDLLRNDLGRVCEYGSVKVPKVCEVESYGQVHHLVSEVTGQLRTGMTALDLLKAAFPGGSVTGAPKVRAMEIIAELEPTARGPYCGSLGWLGFDGAMDSNILIRTMTAGKGFWQFPVGGGIVADSDPETEYAETLHKAAGMLRALMSVTEDLTPRPPLRRGEGEPENPLRVGEGGCAATG